MLTQGRAQAGEPGRQRIHMYLSTHVPLLSAGVTTHLLMSQVYSHRIPGRSVPLVFPLVPQQLCSVEPCDLLVSTKVQVMVTLDSV